MDPWLGLIGVLMGTALGGFITYRIASQRYLHERKTENRRRLITACESIHEILSSISGQASTLNVGVIGDIGYNSPLKGDILKEKVQLGRLRMLVDFYTPSLQSDVKHITDQFTIIARAVTETLVQKEKNDFWKRKTVESATLASIELTKLAQVAQSKLGDLIRSELTDGSSGP